MKLNWILVAVYNDPNDDKMAVVKHVCAYEKEPRYIDIEALREELRVDEDFGMVGDTDFIIMKYSRKEDPSVFEALELPEEID
mgnify:CR=1 FL=1|tara:strand:+ start:1037 stop:1285 length:249 start_codon:yes stop_codon:yes gene_type:complete